MARSGGKQMAGILQQPVGRGQAGGVARGFEVQQQPRPFVGMPGCLAEGPKQVVGLVLVVVEQRLPVRIEMLHRHVMGGPCLLVDDSLADAQCAVQPKRGLQGIGQGKERLGPMHVAVAAAVGL
jgi:hypothetical protein